MTTDWIESEEPWGLSNDFAFNGNAYNATSVIQTITNIGFKSIFNINLDIDYQGVQGFGNQVDNASAYTNVLYIPHFVGDMDNDGGFNVLDIVALVNCVFTQTCKRPGDMNGDGGYNVLDVVSLANCVLAQDCKQYNANLQIVDSTT